MSDITVTTTEGGTTVVTDTLGAAAAAAAAVVSAAAAATSASNASTSASNAASSASAASTSASTATTQAGNASTSASAAASSASAASTSASNAATSASEAAASAAFLNPAAVAITGGTINGTAIGGTTPAAGAFTTLAAGNVAVTGALSATDKLTLTAPSTAQAIEIRNRASDNVYSGIYFKTNDGVTDQTSIQNERVGTNGGRFLLYTKADGGALTNNCILDSTGLAVTGTLSATSFLSAGNIVMASGYVEGSEMTAPAAPATNGFRIFAEDNGAGKTRLMVQFATGAAQQLAIEP